MRKKRKERNERRKKEKKERKKNEKETTSRTFYIKHAQQMTYLIKKSTKMNILKYLGVVDVNLTAVRLRKGKWGGEFSGCMYMSKCVNDTVRTANSVLHDLVIIHPFY